MIDILSNLLSCSSAYGVVVLFVFPVVLWFESDKRYEEFPFSLRACAAFTITLFGLPSAYFILRLCTLSRYHAALILFLIPVVLIVLLTVRPPGKTPFQILSSWKEKFRSARGFISLLAVYFLILAPYLFRNGIDGRGNLNLYDLFATEGLWHGAMVTGLQFNILPYTVHAHTTPYYSYHFFPDLWIEMIGFMSGQSNSMAVFVFVFVPVFLTALALSIYALSRILWKRKAIALAAVFISLFCYDLTALMLWVKGLVSEHVLWFGTFKPVNMSNWTAIITQFQLFHNPSYLMSSALFLGVWVVTKMASTAKTKLLFCAAILGWAFLLKAKITTFLIGMCALGVFAVLKWIRHRERIWLYIFAGSVLLSLPLLALSVGSSKNSVTFSHWFFPANYALRTGYISSSDRALIEVQGYPATITALFKFLMAFLIYYVGLFNLRLAILFRKNPLRILSRFWREPDDHAFSFLSLSAGMGAFVFLCNGLSKYDSMWFYLILIFILNIYLAERFVVLWEQNNEKRFIWVKFVAAFLILCSVGSFAIPVVRPDQKNKLVISENQMAAMRAIRADDGAGRVLTPYFHLAKDTVDEKRQWVAVLSGKPVVSEGVDYVFEYRSDDVKYLTLLKQIRADIARFYTTEDSGTATGILGRYEVRYVYLENSEELKFSTSNLLDTLYRREGITVFKVRETRNPEMP